MVSQDDKGGDKGQRIMDAALRLFTAKGYGATSMDELAREAGIAAGTVYRYFPSKEALVNALFQHWNKAHDDWIFHDYPWDVAAREQFALYWKRNASFAREHTDAHLFLEAHWHDSYLDETSREQIEAQMKRGTDFFEDCRARQITKDIPVELVMAICCGSFNKLLTFWRHGQLDLTDGLIDQAEQCCWEAIRR